MTRPENIPQGILDQVRGFMSKHDVYIGINAEHDMAMMLLQARSQAYAECAKIVEARVKLFTSYGSGLTGRNALKEAANSIRSQATRQHSQKGEDV